MRRILAIDPGASGGIAHFANGRVVVEPMPGTDGDIRDVLINWLSQSDVVYIEKVGGYIGGKGAPGSAMFNFGRNVGFLHGLIASMNLRCIEVTPQRWQKTLGAGTSKTHGTRWKAHLKGLAQQRQPGIFITLKTADAVLLLEHAMLSEGLK
jgi:hypothetical protein